MLVQLSPKRLFSPNPFLVGLLYVAVGRIVLALDLTEVGALSVHARITSPIHAIL